MSTSERPSSVVDRVGKGVVAAIVTAFAVICVYGIFFSDRPEDMAEGALWDIANDQLYVHYKCDGYAPTLSWLAKWYHTPTEKLLGTSAYSFAMTPGPPVDSDLCKWVVSTYFISADPRVGTKEGLKHYGLNTSGLYESTEPIKDTLTGPPPGATKVERPRPSRSF